MRKMLLGVAMILFGSAVSAQETADLRQELMDLRTKVSAMEAAQMAPAASGGAESLTSMKKNAQIKIGGTVEIPVLVVHRDDNPAALHGEGDDIDSTTFKGEAALKIRAYASKNTYMHLKLDLEDFWDNDVDQDDLLEEVYFCWKNVAGHPLTLAFGKKEVTAFGQDAVIGTVDTMTHGNVGLLAWGEEFDSLGNSHGTVGTNDLPGEVDNTLQLEATYKINDIFTVKAAIFQNPEGRGMHEDRSDDTLFFQSAAAKVIATPLEGLEVSVSAINMHNDSMADQVGGGTEDQYAVSAAFKYSVPKLPLVVFGEYLHGYDWTYKTDTNTDTIQLGGIYGLTDNVDLKMALEYASIDGAVAYDDEDYYGIYLTCYYTFDSGIFVGGEYLRQWFDGDVAGGGDHDAEADMFGFVTGWSF